MSDWKEVIEEGRVFFLHDELGNVMKLDDGSYISMLPKVIRLGPFENVEQAKKALEVNKSSLDRVLTEFNQSLLMLCKNIK